MKKNAISCSKIALNNAPTTTGIYLFKEKNTPIYIGKSVNIRARLKSHFENAKIDTKEKSIVSTSNTIEFIIADSEFKALILESKYIQKYKPKYNVRWRDDKSYLYIKITKNVPYPKISITRKENAKNAVYFGPFSSVRVVRNILKEIRRVFPFCTQSKIGKQRCFYAKIHLCNPCPNEIEKASSNALKIRLQRKYLENIRNIIKVLNGQTEIILKKLFKKIQTLNEKQKYEEAIPIRERILRLEGIVSNKKFDEDSVEEYNQSEKQLSALRELLKKYLMNTKLDRIECFDMSTMSFQNSTASMVVFSEGLSDKKEYKRFKIKTEADSDFRMFDEVLRRRFKNSWPKPDLLVVDGGKPQVRVAQKVLLSLDLHIPLIGIAKRPDRLVVAEENLITIRPNRNHPGFRLIQALRDESHRFAKKYHLYLRSRSNGIMNRPKKSTNFTEKL